VAWISKKALALVEKKNAQADRVTPRMNRGANYPPGTSAGAKRRADNVFFGWKCASKRL